MIDLVDAFISQVLSHPTLPAVEHKGVSTSYEELSAFAFRIAGSIRNVASTPSPRVLLVLPHSTSAYAGMIGTLIAGGTFCPVNIDGPASRNAIITSTFSPDIILVEGTPPSFLDNAPATTPLVDLSRIGAHSLDGPSTDYSEIAYVAFTSGSSGEPKGVKIGRGAFSHFLTIAGSYFDLIPGERWAQFTDLNHDLAVMDVFLAVTQGGALVPLSSPKERLMPATAIKECGIAIWQSVPGVLDLMIRANQVSPDYLAPLRLMSFCGDKLYPDHLKMLFSARPDLQVFNTYGATETTGFNTINRLTSDNYRYSCEAATVALGDDVPGWTISLHGGDSVDEGEIVVSSDCLGLGYWRDEDRTRNAFRQLRPEGGEERRSYFTGDWGIRKNSRLYFSCRTDRQVKIWGERIELDEIDYLLRKAGFADAYTIVAEGVLHSFVESVNAVDQDRVRAQLSKSLSFHSIPKTIQSLQSLPRTNGKIDRRALERSVT